MGYKLSKIYIGQTQVRPSTGRKPNANTIAYRPLTNNLNDTVGGYDLTASGSDYSFTTSLQGNKCCALNLGGNSSTTYFTNSTFNSQININNSYTFAFKIGEGVLRTGSWTQASFYNFNRQFDIICYDQYGVSTDGVIGFSSEGFITSSASETRIDRTNKITDSVLHSVVVTYDSSVARCNTYIDGTLVYYITGNKSSKTANQFNIGKNVYDNSQGRYVAAKIAHCVIESGVWDATRISEYSALK